MNAPAESATVQALWEASSQRLRAWFARHTRNVHDAEDLVQETFVRVLAGLGNVREGERLEAWVGAIAAHALSDHGRRRARRTRSLADEHPTREPAAPSACADEQLELERAVAGWTEAFLERLEPEDAAILRSVELEGRSQAELARELRLAPSSARSRVQRARLRLRQQLEDCCTFAFDARGRIIDATRKQAKPCACDGG